MKPQTKQTQDPRITEAIQYLWTVRGAAYYAAAASNMPIQIQETRCGTAATDGRNIYIDPRWLAENPPAPDLAFLLAHEADHCLFGIIARSFGVKNLERYNEAADAATHDRLSSVFPIPAWGITPENIGSRSGLSTDDYFRHLGGDTPPEPPPQDENQEEDDATDPEDAPQDAPEPAGSDSGPENDQESPQSDTSEDTEAPTPDPDAPQAPCDIIPPETAEEARALETHAQIQIAKAATIAIRAAPGTMPGSLANEIARAMAPRVDWRQHLRHFVRKCCTEARSFRSPDRRFLHADTILPGPAHSRNPDAIIIARDGSGSVSNAQWADTLAFLEQLRREFKRATFEVWDWTCSVDRAQTLRPGTPIPTREVRPCGGTNVSAPFEYMDTHPGRRSGIIVMTDGLVGDYPEPRRIPTLWIIHDESDCDRPTWGETVFVRPRNP